MLNVKGLKLKGSCLSLQLTKIVQPPDVKWESPAVRVIQRMYFNRFFSLYAFIGHSRESEKDREMKKNDM